VGSVAVTASFGNQQCREEEVMKLIVQLLVVSAVVSFSVSCSRDTRSMDARSEWHDASLSEVTSAAEAGDESAQCALAWLYRYGQKGLEADIDTAISWYMRSANQGYAEAAYQLGTIYIDYDKHVCDPTQSVECFRKAAELGSPYAQFRLADCYELGEGITKDEEAAETWREKALKNTDPEFLKWAANLYRYSHGGTAQHRARALELYTRLAATGDADACCSIGYMHAWGQAGQTNGTKAIEWFLRAADRGNTEGWMLVARVYDKGWGLPSNVVEAVRWYKKAAERGDDATAPLELGRMYRIGRGVSASPSDAVLWYMRAAEGGNRDACFELGDLYFDGVMVTQSLNEAARLYSFALTNPPVIFNPYCSKEKDLRAAARLALMYEQGKGVLRDHVVANDWLRKAQGYGLTNIESVQALVTNALPYQSFADLHAAADAGDPEAAYEVGRRYRTGIVVQKDEKSALLYLEKAANQNLAKAQLELGHLYAYDNGQDQEAAVTWYRKAAENGNRNAMFFLASHLQGGSGSHTSTVEAVTWIRKAAEAGDSYCQYWLGSGHYWGNTVTQDFGQALHWLEKAAKNDYGEAQGFLAEIYRRGEGAARDSATAVHWFRQAAENGIAQARAVLGFMLMAGEGVPKEAQEGLSWLRKAGYAGIADAQLELARLYAQGENVPPSKAEAARWLRRAADKGHVQAQYALAHFYDRGIGVVSNDLTSVHLYIAAANQGHTNAIKMLNLQLQKRALEFLPLEAPHRLQNGPSTEEWLKVIWDRGCREAVGNVANAFILDAEQHSNISLVLKWLAKADELGNEEAKKMRQDIEAFTELDEQRDFVALVRSATLGHVSSYIRLALLYHSGDTVKQDRHAALKWFSKAADCGRATGEFYLGLYYSEGWCVAKDKQEATKWYRKAAMQGAPEAQYNLGIHYERGEGVPENYKIAAEWFAAAAKHGLSTAQYALAKSYYFGRGVPENYVEAYKWAILAAAQNEDEQTRALRQLLRDQMSSEQIAQAQAMAAAFSTGAP